MRIVSRRWEIRRESSSRVSHRCRRTGWMRGSPRGRLRRKGRKGLPPSDRGPPALGTRGRATRDTGEIGFVWRRRSAGGRRTAIPVFPDSRSRADVSAEKQLCQTNPIWGDARMGTAGPAGASSPTDGRPDGQESAASAKLGSFGQKSCRRRWQAWRRPRVGSGGFRVQAPAPKRRRERLTASLQTRRRAVGPSFHPSGPVAGAPVRGRRGKRSQSRGEERVRSGSGSTGVVRGGMMARQKGVVHGG